MDSFSNDNPVDDTAVHDKVGAFCAHARGTPGVRIALITSGGTTAPLERNCVRFLDNFSQGTRGALSAEEFLKAGYSVIFLSRSGSLQPFIQSLPRLAQSSDLASFCQASPSNTASESHINPSHLQTLTSAAVAANHAQTNHKLLTIHFTTVFQYLKYLETIATTLQEFGAHAMAYMAAAVSDFYIPWNLLPEHKIQSGDGKMVLELENVPKRLGHLRHSWAPQAFHVSFKLETDQDMLLKKAAASISKYGMHCVVANMLHTRKDRVIIVTPAEGKAAERSGEDFETHTVDRRADEPLIESAMVTHIVALHTRFLRAAGFEKDHVFE